jgi:hypothetical protein
MAIVFTQQRKKEKILIFVLIGALLLTAFIIWQGSLNNQEQYLYESDTVLSQEQIKIDFNVLKKPILKELQSFSEIEPLKESTTTVKGKIQTTGSKGRENPFLPY